MLSYYSRLALQRPEAITALISQNGNAYEGLGSAFWAPLEEVWADPTPEKVKALERLLTLEATKRLVCAPFSYRVVTR